MTETVHRLLMFAGGVLTAVAGLAAGTQLVNPQIMGWIAFVGGAMTVAANQWRVVWPDKPAVLPDPPK